MKQFHEDTYPTYPPLWGLLMSLAVIFIAWAGSMQLEYEEQRRQACADMIPGLDWDSDLDVCVPRKLPPLPNSSVNTQRK